MSEPTPIGNVELPGEDIVSPAVLLKRFIDDNASSTVVPAGAVVGGADDTEQQEGVVALMDAGDAEPELYAPIVKKRVQVRCVAGTLFEADSIANYIYELLNGQRWLILEDHEERLWYCYTIYCSIGPSHHIDSSETKESLLFAIITLSREPVGVPES
jgi:hypothetical protein